MRFPQSLAGDVTLTPVRPGVYDVLLGIQRVRVIVVQELPQTENNALLQLFSTRVEQVRYARTHYQPRTTEMTTLFYDLLKMSAEDPAMSEVLKEYAREALKRLLKDVPAEERLEGLSPEQLLERLSPEKRLEGLSPEERLKGLSPDELRAILAETQRLLGANGSAKQPE